MQRTLFYLPHEIFGVPLLGVGWLFFVLLIAFAFWIFRIQRDPKKTLVNELSQNGLLWGVASIAILFILPNVEIQSTTGEPIGVAVRGYGVFLLLGVSSGVALALYRAQKAGIPTDDILGLAMWLFVGGIAGARLFYIIEYRQDFFTGNLITTAKKMLDFTRGGLVVYGSIIGGTITTVAFVYRNWSNRKRHSPSETSKPSRQVSQTSNSQTSPSKSYLDQSFFASFFKLGDVVIPSLFLGIFFGRIGCLMNGCCYGGRCEDNWWALHFPPGSPVYNEQIASGELLGLKLEPLAITDQESSTADRPIGGRVLEVEPNSPADQRGIKPGSFVSQIYTAQPALDQADTPVAADDASQLNVVAVVDATPQVWSADQLPKEALAVSPAQIISSISGLLICILLLALSSFFSLPQGIVTATGFAVYALARFGEEVVRTDEPGQFGTQLSISQWISVLIFPVALAVIIYIYWKRPTSVAEQENANSGTGVPN